MQHNGEAKPFTSTADPDKTIAARKPIPSPGAFSKLSLKRDDAGEYLTPARFSDAGCPYCRRIFGSRLRCDLAAGRVAPRPITGRRLKWSAGRYRQCATKKRGLIEPRGLIGADEFRSAHRPGGDDRAAGSLDSTTGPPCPGPTATRARTAISPRRDASR